MALIAVVQLRVVVITYVHPEGDRKSKRGRSHMQFIIKP